MSIKGEDLIKETWPPSGGEAIVVDPNKYYPVKKNSQIGLGTYEVIGELGLYKISLWDRGTHPYPNNIYVVVATSQDLAEEDVNALVKKGEAIALTKPQFEDYLDQLLNEGYILADAYYSKYSKPDIFAIIDKNYEVQMQLILNRLVPEPAVAKKISNYRRKLEEL